MNKKNVLFTLFIMFLSFSFIPPNVKGEEGEFELPSYYYIYVDVDAGKLDLIFWNFDSSETRIDFYVMDSDDFQLYRLWSSRLMLQELGEKLAGNSRGASGQFQPTHEDTWYFIFLNPSTDEETTIEYELFKFPSYHVIMPFIVVVIIITIVAYALYFYSERNKKEKEETTSVQAQQQQQVLQQSPQTTHHMTFEFCPKCSSKVMNPNAKFCDNCAFDFKKGG